MQAKLLFMSKKKLNNRNTLKPAEEQFNLLTVTIDTSYHFSRQAYAISNTEPGKTMRLQSIDTI